MTELSLPLLRPPAGSSSRRDSNNGVKGCLSWRAELTSANGSSVIPECVRRYLPKRASLGCPQWEGMVENDLPAFKRIQRGVAYDTVGKAMLGWSISRQNEDEPKPAVCGKQISASDVNTGYRNVDIMKVHGDHTNWPDIAGDSPGDCTGDSADDPQGDTTTTATTDGQAKPSHPHPPNRDVDDTGGDGMVAATNARHGADLATAKCRRMRLDDASVDTKTCEAVEGAGYVKALEGAGSVKAVVGAAVAVGPTTSSRPPQPDRRRSAEELQPCSGLSRYATLTRSAPGSAPQMQCQPQQHQKQQKQRQREQRLRLPSLSGKQAGGNKPVRLATCAPGCDDDPGSQVCMHELISHRYLADYRRRLDNLQAARKLQLNEQHRKNRRTAYVKDNRTCRLRAERIDRNNSFVDTRPPQWRMPRFRGVPAHHSTRNNACVDAPTTTDDDNVV